MVDPLEHSVAAYPPPRAPVSERPPGVVLAAAVVTWIAASATAALTLLLTVSLLLVAAPVFEVLQAPDPKWYLVGVALLIVVLSAAADVLAWLMLRGHRWARWVLVGLAVVAAVCGAMLGYYLAPLAVTAAALAVIVLLFLPQARAWFGARP